MSMRDPVELPLIKALWRVCGGKADFGSHQERTWKCPVPVNLTHPPPPYVPGDPPPTFRYVEFRLRRGATGAVGTMGHRITQLLGDGHVLETYHHYDRPFFISPDAKSLDGSAA